MTVPRLMAMKARGKRIVMLTAYDFSAARLLDQAGIDVLLVGDSLGMVVQGYETTLPVTLDQMIYHAEMVGRGAQRALVVVDLPFPIYHVGRDRAVEQAARILKETRCQAVKLEGGSDQAEIIAALVAAGIPVMGHIGLRPQTVHQMGGYRVQRDEEMLLQDAEAVAHAGAFAVVLECIPRDVAAKITAQIPIPTLGIGAGVACDGQVLVLHDLLGLGDGPVPRHAKAYANLNSEVIQAARAFAQDVREGSFPGAGQSFD